MAVVRPVNPAGCAAAVTLDLEGGTVQNGFESGMHYFDLISSAWTVAVSHGNSHHKAYVDFVLRRFMCAALIRSTFEEKKKEGKKEQKSFNEEEPPTRQVQSTTADARVPQVCFATISHCSSQR
jgi:hypothetical protein